MKEWITIVITRELKALRREIESYPTESDLWEVRPGITNPGGNLALHLAGNLQYFLGNVLGKNGYVRNRDAEFGDKDVPRAELLREIDNARSAASAPRPERFSPTSRRISPTTWARWTIIAAFSPVRRRR